MFALFTIACLAIFVAGPLHNEGGADAIQAKGTVVALETAWAERDKEAHKAQARYNQ